MTTATAPVAAPASAPAAPTLADMTTAQLSERMGKLAVRHDELKASVSEYETVKTDLRTVSDEFQKRLGLTPAAPTPAPAAKPKAKAKAKASGGTSTPKAPKADGDKKYPSLKEVVLTVLGKNTDGLDLNGIRLEVEAMIKRGEYHSGAKSLSAVISQAINALKQEGAISRDSDTKKYTKKAA